VGKEHLAQLVHKGLRACKEPLVFQELLEPLEFKESLVHLELQVQLVCQELMV